MSSQETYQSSVDPNEIEEIKSNVINVAQNLINLKKKMLTVQKQYDILTYYKEDLGTRNEKIQNEIYSITEKEHSLQQLFFCIVCNFFPSFITKEQLLLPDEKNIDTSVHHYSEVINQIIRKIRDFYLKANPDKDSIILCQKTAAAIGQRIEDEITPSFNRVEDLYKNYFDPNYKCIPQDFCKTANDLNPKKELMYCARIRGILSKYLHKLDSNITLTENEQTELECEIEREKQRFGINKDVVENKEIMVAVEPSTGLGI